MQCSIPHKTPPIRHFLTREALYLPAVPKHDRRWDFPDDSAGPPYTHNDDLMDRYANHEPDTNKYILKILENIPDDSTILEAGAHVGDTTFMMATYLKKLGKGTMIRAFEPDPDKCEYLELVKKLNRLTNVEVINAGLSDTLSTGSLDKTLHSGAWFVKEGNDFNMTTIDSLLHDRSVSFIKLDVEGYEHKAIKGGLNTIQLHKPLLCVERLEEETYSLIAKSYAKSSVEGIDTFLIPRQST